MSQKGWSDHSGEIIYNSIEVLQKFADMLKNDIAAIAEKERSMGFLNEQMSDELIEMNKQQFPMAKQAINMFVVSLSQVEYARKFMYQRDHQISREVFQSSLELARSCKDLLKARENALRKYTIARQNDLKSAQPENVAAATTSFQSLNTQAVQSAATYSNQVHRDLITVLSSFAHAQMELHARSLETWSRFIETMDDTPLEDDTESVVNSLKESAETYTKSPQ